MSFKALIIDFDDTLSNRKLSAYNFYKDVILEERKDLKDYELEGILQDCMNWDLGGHYNKSFVKENLERKYKISLKHEDFNKYFGNHFGAYTVLYDGVIDTLLELKKQGYATITINTLSDKLEAWLKNTSSKFTLSGKTKELYNDAMTIIKGEELTSSI